jgi:hypothetical protein
MSRGIASKIQQEFALTIFAGLLLAGCDLFRTRPTEPPLDSGSPWIYPTQIEQVFLNMKQAMAELNSEHYLRCFFTPDDPGKTYLFIPNPNSLGWPLTTPWGYSEEQRTIQYLFTLMQPGSIPFLTLLEESRYIYGNNDSVRVTQNYTLDVPVNDPTLPTEVSGRADFILAKNSTGYWAIYRWEDLEGNPSWTDLKAGLY